MAESMATSLQHMVESTVKAAVDEERKLEQLLFAPPTESTVVASIDAAKAQQFDAILVLGGGVPLAPRKQLPFVAARCQAAAAVWRAAATKPKILCLSAGTAHCPQLLDARGSVVFEATASAAELIDAGVDEQDVFVETTSFDTIGNAFFARTDHCSLAGWKRLLIITSEFHMARSKAIFDWVFGATPHEGFELTFLATPDAALEPDAVAARAKREAASAINVRRTLAPTYTTLSGVREFLVTKHDLYAARGLVARGSRRPAAASDALLLASYGGGAAAPTSAWRAIALGFTAGALAAVLRH